jgi:hypothetical protein
MSTELTNNDYKNILLFYKKKIPKSRQLLKRQAEDILSEKLCRCIKKLDPKNESKSIAICTKSIFINKKLKRGKFNCKGKRSVKITKNISNITRKQKS